MINYKYKLFISLPIILIVIRCCTIHFSENYQLYYGLLSSIIITLFLFSTFIINKSINNQYFISTDRFTFNLLILLLFLSLAGLFVGLINGWNKRYLFGDTYNIIYLPFMYFIGIVLLSQIPKGNVIYYCNKIILNAYISAILYWLYMTYRINYIDTNIRYSYIYPLNSIIFVYFFTYFILYDKLKYIFIICIIIVIFLNYLSYQRSIIVQNIINVILILILLKNYIKINIIKIFQIFGLIFILIIFIFYYIDNNKIYNKRLLFNSQYTDSSIEVRIMELKDIFYTHEKKGDMLDIILGFGSGAGILINNLDFLQINVLDDYGDGRKHNIHITPAGLYFRYGIFGLIIFLFLVYYIWNQIKIYYFKGNYCYKKILFIKTIAIVSIFSALIDSFTANKFFHSAEGYLLPYYFTILSLFSNKYKKKR